MDGWSNKKRVNHGEYRLFPDRIYMIKTHTCVESHWSAICGRKSFLSLVQLYALDLVIPIS